MTAIDNQPVGTRENAAIRRLQVLDLRKTGLSTRVIGAQVGVSHTQVRNDLRTALRELVRQEHASTEEWRQLELERLDRYLLALEPAILRGEIRAVEAAIKLSESRRKMLGIDPPVKVDWRADAERAGIDPDALYNAALDHLRTAVSRGDVGGSDDGLPEGATEGSL